MARLHFINDGSEVTLLVPEGESLIGRHPDSDLPIPNGTVSGRHALLVKEGDNISIEDVGSRNGTFVNGHRLAQNQREILKHEDQLQLGQLVGRFEAAPPRAPASLRGTAAFAPAGDLSSSTGLAASIDFTDDESTTFNNIRSEAVSTGRFGGLDVQPEAKLEAVLNISSALAGAVGSDSVLNTILDSLFSIFRYADRGCILLKDNASGNMIPRAVKHRRAGADESVRLSRTIINKVLDDKAGILSADASTDAQFSGSESISELRIRSMMCVPMLGLDGSPRGVISIDSQNPLGQFTNDDLELLMTVAGQAALSFENARLMETFLEKQKQDSEMDIAKGVQQSLLPEVMPAADGWEFYASYDSAQAVGGDYYDLFEMPDGRICLSFGDVAGKGVPGALIMSRMSSCVQSTLRHVHDVETAINAINDHMCDSRVEGRFVTYVLAMVDTKTGEVELANAGHMSPMIRRVDGTVVQFDDELVGPPIGVVDGYPYDVDRRTIAPGETVVIVTDGVDEALNAQGGFYGAERVLEFVHNHSAKADELGRDLLADVRRHAAGHPQNDDITIMTFGRNST